MAPTREGRPCLAGRARELEQRQRACGKGEILAQHAGAEIEPAAQQRIGWELSEEARPVVEGGERSLGPFALVRAGDEDGSFGSWMVEGGSASDADAAVGHGQQRFVDARELLIEAVDGQRPVRVCVHLGNVALPPPLELILQEREECVRAAAERDDAGWSAGRLGTDRNGGRSFRLGDEQQRITTRQPAERAELVTGDEHEPGADAASQEVVEYPARRVGLVRQADLDVLRVARHPCIGKAGVACGLLGDLDCLLRPSNPASWRRCWTASSSSAIRAFGGSAHSGSGMRSIFRRFRRWETISAPSPRAASAATVLSAALSSAAFSSQSPRGARAGARRPSLPGRPPSPGSCTGRGGRGRSGGQRAVRRRCRRESR